MQPARALRDVLTDLVGDGDAAGPADVLAAGGHAGLPVELVAEAVGSFADTSPIEVAEHLSPYVMANSPVPLPDAPAVDLADWLEAVTTAPPPADVDPTARLDDVGVLHESSYEPAGVEVGDLDFGHGHADAGPDHHASTVDTFDHEHDFDAPADYSGYEPIDGTFDSASPDPAALDHFPVPDDTPDDGDDADDLPDA
jgi:hypothetical protein